VYVWIGSEFSKITLALEFVKLCPLVKVLDLSYEIVGKYLTFLGTNVS
jgi:hypothetical protein